MIAIWYMVMGEVQIQCNFKPMFLWVDYSSEIVHCYGVGQCEGKAHLFQPCLCQIKDSRLSNHSSRPCCLDVCAKFLFIGTFPILHYYLWVKWKLVAIWCQCSTLQFNCMNKFNINYN
jgi:hypothetical protein